MQPPGKNHKTLVMRRNKTGSLLLALPKNWNGTSVWGSRIFFNWHAGSNANIPPSQPLRRSRSRKSRFHPSPWTPRVKSENGTGSSRSWIYWTSMTGPNIPRIPPAKPLWLDHTYYLPWSTSSVRGSKTFWQYSLAIPRWQWMKWRKEPVGTQ